MDNKKSPEQNNHTTSADFMVKRKRGRPRKHHKPDDSNNHSPPGFSRSQHKFLQNDAMVGQHVTGVIEAAFDDGFLLSVKVGDSDTMLRGVVFKPGHFHPVSTDNDVAHHVPMIRSDNHLVDLHRSEAQGGRKSRLHEKRGARALVPVHHGYMQTKTESRVSGASNGYMLTQVTEKGQDHTTLQFTEAESEEHALSIEPLQAIHPVYPVHMSKPIPSYGRGNMTELLQAVQENVRETHFSQGQ